MDTITIKDEFGFEISFNIVDEQSPPPSPTVIRPPQHASINDDFGPMTTDYLEDFWME